MSEWAKCILEWHMPGGLELLYCDGLEVGTLKDDNGDDDDSAACLDSFKDSAFCWTIFAGVLQMPKVTGFLFIDRYFLGADDFYLSFSIECSYSSLAYYDAKLKPSGDKHAPLREAAPDRVIAVRAETINLPSCPFYDASPLEYLNVMENWMVVARHLQDDATELQVRFEEVYLLVEVGVRKDVSIESADEDENKEENEDAIDIAAFALVSVVDEAALLDLFNNQSTPLQSVKRGEKYPRFLPVEDRVVRISILDLGENRVVKLSEGPLHAPAADLIVHPEITAPCQFVCYEEKIEFYPSFKAKEKTWREGADQYVVTVKLSIFYVPNYDEDENAEEDENVCDHGVLLELWKTLELCMTTGGAVYVFSEEARQREKSGKDRN